MTTGFPSLPARSCDHCGRPVDPLRAARVAIFGEVFRYFCSAACREAYEPGAPRPRSPAASQARSASQVTQAMALRQEDVIATSRVPDDVGERQRIAGALGAIEELSLGSGERTALIEEALGDAAAPPDPSAGLPEVVEPLDLSALLVAVATVSGSLSLLLGLAGSTMWFEFLRATLLTVGAGALVLRSFAGSRDATEPHPLALLTAPTLGALGSLGFALSRVESVLPEVAGVTLVSVAAGIWLVERARRPIEAEREQIASALDAASHRVTGEGVSLAAQGELHPGEEILIEAGETVPADVTITAGEAEVEPWLGASHTERRGEAEALVAGARVVSGRVRAVVGWSGLDRAWVRLTHDPRRRAELIAPSARSGRLLVERAAPILALVAGLAGLVAGGSPSAGLVYGVAVLGALATAGIAQIGAVHVGMGVLASLRSGVAYRSAQAFERAGMATVGAFCARGTLLLGEPEVASIEVFGERGADQERADRVLSLAAGAEAGALHPLAVAVLRAARQRGVRPDGVRSVTVLPGLGVTGVASSGEPLAVGSRALMLRERVSVASVEERVTALESMGRTALLVAQGERLVGLLGLQDGLRQGARAAVQYLLDAGVEPVLISGEARETCEALGRSLDIDHIRPEIAPADRGLEVRRLSDAGAQVVVFGRSPTDDVALGAADVSVALASAGGSTAEWHVQLVSDRVRDAAYAIAIALRSRRAARLGVVLAVVPPVAAAATLTVGALHPAIAPLAGLVGTSLAVLRARARSR